MIFKMNKLLILISIILLGFQVQAQKTNLIFFTEQGERFYLVLNGIQQNAEAQTNVMVTDLPAPSYKLKIKFEDTQLGEIDKNIMFGQGTETTFVIKKSNKNEWVVRYMNEVPLAQAPPPPPDRPVLVYSTVPPAPAITVIQTSTTTTTTAPIGGTAVGVSVADPATGVNINMNIGGVATGTTTTTTSSITTSSMGAGTVAVIEEPPVYALPGYSGPIGCHWPMSSGEFDNVKNSISSKSFEDSKLTIAKQVINVNCLLCGQVKEIMLLFSYEDTRLELAKYAYGYTYDIGNYYQLNDAFTFESSIEELNEYINTFRW